MSIGFPSPYSALVDESPMSTTWLRYFQQLHNSSGLGGANFPLWSNRGMISALAMEADPIAAPQLALITGGLVGRTYLPAGGESLHAHVILGSGYETGVDLRAHVRWMATTVATGTVRWGIEYAWCDVNTAPVAATVYADADASGLPFEPVVKAFDSIPGSKLFGPGSAILMRVFRDAAGTYADNAVLIAAGFVTSDNMPGTAEVKP